MTYSSLQSRCTNEGTGSKPGVLDVPSDDSEEELSWNSSDDEDVDEQTKGRDESEGDKTDESDDDDDDQDEAEKVNDGDDNEEEVPKIDEQETTESDEGDNEATKSDRESLRIGEEERMQEEEEVDELYRDVDINQGRGLQVSQETEDSHVLVEAYDADKTILDTYGESTILKRRRKDDDQEGPSVGSDWGSKRRREGGVHASASTPSEPATRKEPVQTTCQMEEPSHPVFETGAEDQPIVQTSQHREWLSQPSKPPTPDRDWNKSVPAAQGNAQSWISTLVKQTDARSSFNELLNTPIDFSNFIMNRLGVDTLTPDLLAGPTYELMRGSCNSLTELEYHLEEIYKVTTDQLDWINPEGQQYPHDLLQPLSLIPDNRGRRVIPFEHFINNDLEYLRGGDSSRKYTTSVTKTKVAYYGHIKWIEDLVPRAMWIQEPISYDKHALWGVSHWGRKRQQFNGFAVNQESALDVYSKRRIVAITELKIVEWHNYKHLDWISVRRDDDKIYKFKEGNLKRLRIQDIEDMLPLLVQGKLSTLTVEERFVFNVSLRMFTRSIVIRRQEPVQPTYQMEEPSHPVFKTAIPPIHNHVLIPNYQDFKIQDFRYSDGFECYQAINIGRKTVASESTNQKSRYTTRKLYDHITKTCSWWYPKFTPPGYKWKPKSQIGNVNPKVSMPLGNASRTANILEPMTPRRSTVSNTTLYSNSFAAHRDYPIHHRLWIFIPSLFKIQLLPIKFAQWLKRHRTEFLNKTFHAYFASEGILHQTSVARTPEQNFVVERRNRILVETARTILSATKVPLFFWAEAIATTYFTQNRSLVIPQREKTPYHIINDRKSSVKFFHIFGSLCYIVGDGENLDKMKGKSDTCIFVGYSTQSRAYMVFNKRTRVIVETINVNFDELPQIASDHVNSDPVPKCQRTAFERDSLSLGPQFVSKSSAVTTADAPLNTQTTPEPTCQVPTQAPIVSSTENINQEETISENSQVEDDEFINIFYTPVHKIKNNIMGWVMISDIVVDSYDAVVGGVVTASRRNYWNRVFKIKDALENKQYKPEDIQELLRELFNDEQNIHEELIEYINTPGWNRPAFYNNGDDDDEDCTVAVTPDFSITDSLIMENEHLDTILETESDEFIKSSVENLVLIPSESKDFFDIESECDMLDCDDSQITNFLTFSNPIFDDSTSSDDESSHEEVIHEMSFKTYSNPLFDLDEEIISSEFNPIHNEDLDSTPKNDHSYTDSYLLESSFNRDTLMISSLKIDSLLAEFAGELIFLESIPPGVDEANCDPEEDNHLVERFDDQSLPDEDVPEKIYSNPLFDEEIIPTEIDPHSFNAEYDLIKSMLNNDSSIIIPSKIDSLLDEFAGELTLLKSIPPGIDETDCHLEEEIRLTKRLLYDNSSPRPPEEFVSDNSNADIKSFSPSPVPIKDSDSHMEEIDSSLNPVEPNLRDFAKDVVENISPTTEPQVLNTLPTHPTL
nr:retrovirus-related Pol polyprotein from transposon TNT 1-94 [Tanacetum cinerariifolium]